MKMMLEVQHKELNIKTENVEKFVKEDLKKKKVSSADITDLYIYYVPDTFSIFYVAKVKKGSEVRQALSAYDVPNYKAAKPAKKAAAKRKAPAKKKAAPKKPAAKKAVAKKAPAKKAPAKKKAAPKKVAKKAPAKKAPAKKAAPKKAAPKKPAAKKPATKKDPSKIILKPAVKPAEKKDTSSTLKPVDHSGPKASILDTRKK